MTGKKDNILLFNIFLFVLILTVSCGRNLVYSENTALPEEKWDMKNVLVFDVPVDDSVSSNNIIYTIRTATSYPFRNIWLFVSTTSPSGKVLTDTVQYNLADEKGNRYGRGFGNILELDLPYRSSVWFPEKGTYTFRVVHGMRPGLLEGVTDFGLRIEKTK